MNQDANHAKDAAPSAPAVHTATLSEPQAQPGKPAKKAKPAKPEPTTLLGKLWHNWVKPIGSVVVVVVVFRSMLLDWNDVPSGSMEPEIHVGDRIAVNRLAFGLQFPLTGPTIGIPFTPLQWDNPLDGIPQIAWGSGPARGDIVTFWNPVTDVRMVKRIVAGPGDIVEMSGGQLTINGQTASYTDLDPVAEGLPLKTKWQVLDAMGKPKFDDADLAYQSETILGLTRTVQHIEERWLQDAQVIALPDALGTRHVVVEDGWILQWGNRVQRFDQFLQQIQNPAFSYQVVATVNKGAISMGGQATSYNQLAQVVLREFQVNEQLAASLKEIGLAVQGHELLVDGKAVALELFRVALESRANQLMKLQRAHADLLYANLGVMYSMLMTSFGPVTLDDDAYFMVGDNRNNSHDSRYFGPVKRSEITGKAFAVAFSFKDNKMLAIPPKPAWSRFFKDLD